MSSRPASVCKHIAVFFSLFRPQCCSEVKTGCQDASSSCATQLASLLFLFFNDFLLDSAGQVGMCEVSSREFADVVGTTQQQFSERKSKRMIVQFVREAFTTKDSVACFIASDYNNIAV